MFSTKIFLTSSVNRVAGDIAKKLGGAKNKKLLYIYTAYEKKLGEPWQLVDKKALVKAGFKLIDYTLTGQTATAIKKAIQAVDGIYITGGNVFYLMQQIQLTKSASVFCEAVKSGKIYIGTSAGSVIAGPDIYPVHSLDRLQAAPKLKGYKGLSFVDFVILPHWGGSSFKRKYRVERLAENYNTKHKLILLNDYQYMEVKDDWYRMVEVKHKLR